MMRRARYQIKTQRRRRRANFLRQPIPSAEKHGSTIAEMQIDRAAVSTVNGASRNIRRAIASRPARFPLPVL
jgi:hypothetical protein